MIDIRTSFGTEGHAAACIIGIRRNGNFLTQVLDVSAAIIDRTIGACDFARFAMDTTLWSSSKEEEKGGKKMKIRIRLMVSNTFATAF